jgi:hypothetical protein
MNEGTAADTPRGEHLTPFWHWSLAIPTNSNALEMAMPKEVMTITFNNASCLGTRTNSKAAVTIQSNHPTTKPATETNRPNLMGASKG